jgi:hypothetical protein
MKVKAIASVLKNTASSILTTKIYTILAESSTLTLDGSVTLCFSESNEKSGHHHITLSREPHQLEYKLEWQTVQVTPQTGTLPQQQPLRLRQTIPVTQQTHRLELYSISEVPYRPEENFSISIISNSGTVTIEVCCGKPPVEQHGDERPYLLKAFTFGQLLQQVTIKFGGHNRSNCTCKCHPPIQQGVYVSGRRRARQFQ